MSERVAVSRHPSATVPGQLRAASRRPPEWIAQKQADILLRPASETILLPRLDDPEIAGPGGMSQPGYRGGSAAAGVAIMAPEQVGRQRALAQLAWLLPTLVSGVIGFIRVNWPALWADELATWGAVTISWGRLWEMVQHTDATLAGYYALMHLWISVAPDSDVQLRLPSVLAMAGTAGLTARIGTRLGSPRIGLLSGLLFAVLPAVSRYGQEARPYALVVFAATLCTLALLRALDRPRFWQLAAYACTISLVGTLHAIALLLVPAHAMAVLAVRRPVFRRWLVAAVIGAMPALPILYLGSGQTAQVDWIASPTFSSVTGYPTALLGTTIGAGMILVAGLYSVSTRHPGVVYTSWAVVPVIGLLAASQLTTLWLPRYLLFTVPAWALVAGTALGRTRLIRGSTIFALVAAVGLTSQAAIREPAGHLQDTRAAASLISTQMKPGDAIVYSSQDNGLNVYGTPDRVGRDLVAHYIPADRRPLDVLQAVPQRTDGRVRAVECTDVAKCLGKRPRVWVLRLGHQGDPLEDLGGTKSPVIHRMYYVDRVWYPAGMTVALTLPKPTA
jgi:mannosyltransferase